MTPESSVGTGADTGEPPRTPYGWDWSATTHEARDRVVNDLIDALGGAYVLPGKGLQGWSQSAEAYDAEGYKVGSVYFGGSREDVHVVSTSEHAQEKRAAVLDVDRAWRPDEPERWSRTARVDTRVDTLQDFDEVADLLREAANRYGSRITTMQSEERGESLGRTVYLGAPSSAVRVRLYEKWLESPGKYDEGTNRVEVQLRPPSRVKGHVSEWTPAQTFCASRVTQDLARLLGDKAAPEASLHVSRGTPDLERTMRAMGEQYGRAAERFLEWSAGDVDRMLEYLLGGGAPEETASAPARRERGQSAVFAHTPVR